MSRLWLIQFTDLVSLLLTFVVMLYATADPAPLKPLTGNDRQIPARAEVAMAAGPDALEAGALPDRLRPQGLPLPYLAGVLRSLVDTDARFTGMRVRLDADTLTLSFPADLVFESGEAVLSAAGQTTLMRFADLVSPIRNRIEVHGHADPRPIATGRFPSNWHLSLARAETAAAILSERGYSASIRIVGFGAGRFNQTFALTRDSQDGAGRRALARRVDVVIHNAAK